MPNRSLSLTLPDSLQAGSASFTGIASLDATIGRVQRQTRTWRRTKLIPFALLPTYANCFAQSAALNARVLITAGNAGQAPIDRWPGFAAYRGFFGHEAQDPSGHMACEAAARDRLPTRLGSDRKSPHARLLSPGNDSSSTGSLVAPNL